MCLDYKAFAPLRLFVCLPHARDLLVCTADMFLDTSIPRPRGNKFDVERSKVKVSARERKLKIVFRVYI